MTATGPRWTCRAAMLDQATFYTPGPEGYTDYPLAT
jgi:hypothetical protein